MSQTAKEIFHSNGGVMSMSMSEALSQGISRHCLYQLRDSGVIERISCGLYRLADLPPIGNPDLVIVGCRFPHAVTCIVSALTFHDITTQIPHTVSSEIPGNAGRAQTV
ncbi:type IV toxin-antitoxin system AbiEi family antitoxin domain-containing protein [Spirochaeta dissipatitropha]